MSATTPRWLSWWRRSSPQRFEDYTRWSMYSLFGLEVFLGLVILSASGTWDLRGEWPFLVLLAAHAALGVRTFAVALTRVRRGGGIPVVWAAPLLAVTVGLGAVATFGFPGPEPAGGALLLWALVVLGSGTVVALSPSLPLPALLLVAVGMVAAVVGTTTAASALPIAPAAIGSTLGVFGVAVSGRLTVWTLMVVWELDEGRTVAARLAVAEERLRFSRDLHDVFGRTLSTVAVKSELAAALAARGDERGVEEMLEVRRIAHDALREVRGVAQGYRAADLDAEIAGALALLRSAGVRTEVSGQGLDLPPDSAEAAAWVVREGVTNVVRHSAARASTIDVRREGADVSVTVRNDGVDSGRLPGPEGGGLRGLRERLGERGGTLATTAEDDSFELHARIPASSTTARPTTEEPR